MTKNIHRGSQVPASPEERRRFRRWLWILVGVAGLLTIIFILLEVVLAERLLPQNLAGSLSGAPVAFSPDGHILAAGSGDTIKLWDVRSGTLLHTLASIHMKYVVAQAFSPDGHTLAAGTDARQASCSSNNNPPCLYGVILWDVQSGEVSSSSSFSPYILPTVSSLAFSPNGRTLAITDFDGVDLWDVANAKPLATLQQQFTEAVAFSPDGHTLVSSSNEYTDYGGSAHTFPPGIDFWGSRAVNCCAALPSRWGALPTP
jgi:WD40 repeat protein